MLLSGLSLLVGVLGVVEASVDTIDVRLYRFDGKSGSTFVSSGIPLPPGRLQPDQTKALRLIIDGEEQPIRVEALSGLHRDGSLRSVLVQLVYDVPRTRWVSGELIIGEARTTQEVREPEGFDRGRTAAVTLPTDPDYLVSTQLNGPTVTSSYSKTMGPVFASYERAFVQHSETHWQKERDQWGAANYYDRALIFYAFWLRTGNPAYFNRATLIALNYRERYLEANNYASSPHWSQVEGLEQHYLLTGDEQSRFAVARVAEQFVPLNLGDTISIKWTESRIQARSLQALYLAWRLRAEGPKKLNYGAILDRKLKHTLSTQRADGSTGWPVTCYESLNYMHGLLNDQLINIYTNFRADSAIVTFVRRNVDYLWRTQWVQRPGAFKYLSGRCQKNAQGEAVGGPNPTPDLNMLFVTGFGWLYQMTGDASYRQAGDEIFAAGVRGAYWPGSKQFNQTFTSSYKYLALRLAPKSSDRP